MRRGEVWTVAGGPDYAGKPRPAIVVQDENFGQIASITICALTSDDQDLPIFRVRVHPSELNGLRRVSRAMVDKITTIPRGKVGDRIGRLDASDLANIDRAIIVFLGLTALLPTDDDRTVGAAS